jgi:peptidoglycan/LPS O-acetylase OafA/YrhL
MLDAPPTYAPTLTAARPERAARASLHIPSLDGLRAVSFFIVFLAHAGLENVVPGGFGVTVFFFLSGYLITTLMRREVERTGHVSIRNFYLRRVLRILPPFYIVLVGATALAAAGTLGTVELRTGPLLAQALHFSNYLIAFRGWGGVAPGTGVYWSLAVEEHFYLIFPALFLVLHRMGLSGKEKALVFWSLCAVVLLWRCVLVLGLHSNVDRTYLCSDTRIDSILFGSALAVWNNPALGDGDSNPERLLVWQRFLLPLGLAVLFATFVIRDGVFRETARYSLQGLALTPIFVAAIRWPRLPLFQPLNWSSLRFAGNLSYSLYLLHQVALAGVARLSMLGPVGQGVLALGIAFGVAWGLYRLVEAPCARLRKRLFAAD